MTLSKKEALDILSKIHGVEIIVIGDLMLDRFVTGTTFRQSPEAPVPILNWNHDEQMPGGAANVALNLKKLGCTPSLIGVRGQDAPGESLVDLIAASDIDASQIIIDPSRVTTTKTRLIKVPSQHLLRLDHESLNPLDMSSEKLIYIEIQKKIHHARAILVSDYAKGTMTPSLCDYIKKECKDRSLRCIFDPKPKNKNSYQNASLLTPNAKEASELSGLPCVSELEVEACGKKLVQELNLESLLITRSENGMSLFLRNEIRPMHIPAYQSKVQDVSGAGDTVIAAFTAAVTSGVDWIQAAHFANLASGISISKVGTSFVTPAEIERAFQT